MAKAGGQVPLVQRRLLDLKLFEVPKWTLRRLVSPKAVFCAMCRGHDTYYKKYIDVKKGGIGGVAMFLMGYVVISYIWNYSHIKHDRWRKHH
ncbi:ATP synthase subunit f, mitochondrial isoform X1 [Amblyraja radiata]|uniref:ATP synthase subunit f, mitochondrial isoform X1 n=1 Tax=Amblyraja radiata TaxID=386614 RepID=UPI00140424B7|nr:ATP synthase subunit f, mitochondrial isoform X1 [Amblyraja radiata]